MGRSHVIEKHPQRQKIIDALLAGESDRKIAEFAGVSRQAIWNYKTSVFRPALKQASKLLSERGIAESAENAVDLARQGKETLKQATTAVPIVQRLLQRQERRERWMQGAEAKEDYKALSALDGCEHRDIRLEAELAGLLDVPAQQSTTNNILVMMPQRPAATEPAPASQVIDVSPKE